MTRYIVRLYSDNKALIHDMRIECNRQDVPGRLACISMWELISFHVVFMVCVIASARGVSSPQGLKNSDTYPFEALPHYHSSSICQNYFAISTTRLSLNA